jgi:hypothetical protein
MNKLLTFFAACILALSTHVSATLIDFDALADGSYGTIGDTQFSLVGEGVTGDPYKNSFFGHYLYNSSSQFIFPTNTVLRVDFSSAVKNLSFDLNGFGPESSLMNWRIFDDSYTEIAIGNDISASLAQYDLSAYSGINRIEFFNGGGNTNRFFGLNKISFDVQAASVPEPSTMFIFLLALVGLTSRRITLK